MLTDNLSQKLTPYYPYIVVSLAFLVLFGNLGVGSLKDWDEAIYAQIAKEIVNSGDWLTLHWNYTPWFHKPPLFMWLTAILYQLFGVNEFTARGVSALSGVGVVILTYLTAKLLYNPKMGMVATVIILTCYHFVFQSRFGTTDVLLTFFTMLTIYAYLMITEKQPQWWYLVGVASSLAFMTKGIGGIIAPITVFLALILEKKLITTIKSSYFWQSVILAIAIILPWHLFMVLKHGSDFMEVYFGYHTVSRATESIEGHSGNAFFYFLVLNKQFFPWVYLVPFALIISLKDNLQKPSQSRIILILFFLVFGLYTLVATKLDWYIVPVYPPLAILIAFTFVKLWKQEKIAVIGFIITAILAAIITPFKVVFLNDKLQLILAIISIFFLIIIFTLFKIKKITYHLAIILVCGLLFISGLREIRGLYSLRQTPISKLAIIAKTDDKSPLIVAKLEERLYMPTPLFYSDRPIFWARDLENLATFVNEDKIHDIIMGKKDIKNLSNNYEIKTLSIENNLVYAKIYSK